MTPIALLVAAWRLHDAAIWHERGRAGLDEVWRCWRAVGRVLIRMRKGGGK